jgi:hypothetical protein
VLFNFLQAWRVKRKVTLVLFFWDQSYLRNGWSVNLRAIENCIFTICSIERNMRPILRTVHAEHAHKELMHMLRMCMLNAQGMHQFLTLYIIHKFTKTKTIYI